MSPDFIPPTQHSVSAVPDNPLSQQMQALEMRSTPRAPTRLHAVARTGLFFAALRTRRRLRRLRGALAEEIFDHEPWRTPPTSARPGRNHWMRQSFRMRGVAPSVRILHSAPPARIFGPSCAYVWHMSGGVGFARARVVAWASARVRARPV